MVSPILLLVKNISLGDVSASCTLVDSNKPKGDVTCLLNKCVCLYLVSKREFSIASE